MHPHFQTDTAHADRLAHIILTVDDKFLRHGMQELLVSRNIDCLGGFNDSRYVSGSDFLVLDGDHAG